jgi:hypothetical protein
LPAARQALGRALKAGRLNAYVWANGEELARLAVETGPPISEPALLVITVDHRNDGEAEARFSRLVVANAR